MMAIVSNRAMAGSEADAIALDAFVAGMAADLAALKATFKPVIIITAPTAPIVSPGIYQLCRTGLTVALGTPPVWRGGLVTFKDFTGVGSPNLTITGAIDGGSGATINAAGEALSFAWSIADNYWVTT